MCFKHDWAYLTMSKVFMETNNPSLWQEVPVGRLDYSPEKSKLVENLNHFAKTLDIVEKKDHDLPGYRFQKEVNPFSGGHDFYHMDHFNFFKRSNKAGYVAIFSPYGGINEDARPILEEYGYTAYERSLYCLDTTTYIKLITQNKPIG